MIPIDLINERKDITLSNLYDFDLTKEYKKSNMNSVHTSYSAKRTFSQEKTNVFNKTAT